MSFASFVLKPAISAGLSSGLILAIGRPVIGAAPNLIQDFSCTIGGALVGEIISEIGAFLVEKTAAGNDRNTGLRIVIMTFIHGGAGIAIGTTTGMLTSIALSSLRG